MKRPFIPFIVFVFCLFAASLNAQQPVFRHYTVDDGLPSNEIYHVIQDSKGYIWLATNMGVSRYDGHTFRNFDKQDGLSENTVFEIYEDEKGRVWFVSFPCQLAYFYNDSIISYKYNDLLKNEVGAVAIPVKSSFFISKNDEVKIGVMSEGLISIDNKGNLKKLHPSGAESTEAHLFLQDDKVLVSQGKIMFLYRINIHEKGIIQKYFINNKVRNFSHRQLMAIRLGQDQVAFMQNDLLAVFTPKKEPVVKFMDFRIFGIYTDNNDNLWLATDMNGAICYDKGRVNLRPLYHLLNGISVSSVCQDSEGGRWFSTLAEGLYYLPSGNFNSYTKESGLTSSNINKLILLDGKLIAGTKDQFINIIMNNNISNLKVSNTKNDIIQALSEDKKGMLWIGTNEYLYSLNKLKTIKRYENYSEISSVRLIASKSKSRWIFSIKNISNSYDGGLWLGESNCFSKFINGRVVYNSLSTDNIGLRVEAILQTDSNTVYIGATSGLWRRDKTGINNLKELNSLLGNRITDMKFNESASQLYIGTKGSGLLTYNLKASVTRITKSDGLSSNSITSLAFINGYLWVATNRGLNCFDPTKIGTREFKINSYFKQHGLISNEINQIAGDSNNIYIATNQGITVFNYRVYQPVLAPPPVYINAFSIMNKDTIVQSGYRINNEQKLITIEFIGISYRDADNIKYRYRLVGLSDNWINTKNTVVEYAFLPSGSYKFEVIAINADGIESHSAAQISFTILPPFWKTWWFISISIFVISVIIYLYYINRVRQLRKEHQLRNDINWYRQQALGKQMDPHFVFNTLNSIQSYIIKNDRLASSQYLSKFAKLMRLILNSSQKQAVPLNDEISALSLYLELESLRFEQKFDYHLNIDPTIDPLACFIPPFMIQPFIENAIWHGIMGIKGVGCISIYFVKNQNKITCTIEDNGIGREKSKLMKSGFKRDQKSLGISLVESRLNLLNSLYGIDMHSLVTDLYDKDGHASGTKVVIDLPLIT